MTRDEFIEALRPNIDADHMPGVEVLLDRLIADERRAELAKIEGAALRAFFAGR